MASSQASILTAAVYTFILWLFVAACSFDCLPWIWFGSVGQKTGTAGGSAPLTGRGAQAAGKGRLASEKLVGSPSWLRFDCFVSLARSLGPNGWLGVESSDCQTAKVPKFYIAPCERVCECTLRRKLVLIHFLLSSRQSWLALIL